MKTAPLTYPTYHLIDTAPLAARYAALTRAVLAYLAAGQFGLMLKSTHKVRRLVRVFTNLEARNARLRRKLEMLSHRPWRELVVKELGGLKRLRRWEASYKRITARFETGDNKAVATPEPQAPWLLTPERIAESERLKAHVRACGRAAAHPLIYRDQYRMDSAGEFRLAPLPRAPRGERAVKKVYTKNSITDYEWNPIPIAKETGFGPAVIWPVEIYAAMAVEDTDNSPFVIPDKKRSDANLGSNPIESCLTLAPLFRGVDKKERCNTDKMQEGKNEDIPRLSLQDVLSRKVYDDLCGSSPR